MGIRDRPTAPRSPWQNAYVERLIGSIRRECLDHLVIFGEARPCRVLRAYTDYYNRTRTHLSLSKDTLSARSIPRQGRIRSTLLPRWPPPFVRQDLICGRDREHR
ncbi:MAG: integrase core domain-containing protein [Planctomycetota bacterium]|nr:integrase core domain-containing protein [Planctomycetota bacterium]